jgi:predicted DNA-binding transcriptional regulator AlpA
MCTAHLVAWKKLVRIPRSRIVGDAARFDYYTLKNPSKEVQRIFGAKPDCVIWGGGLNPWGYSQFRSDWSKTEGGSAFGHLYAWVIVGGRDRDPERETDHLCRFRPCVNHEHLEQVSQKVNTLRGVSPTAQNARKTHCDRGHAFAPENTRIGESGWRTCLTCERAYSQTYNREYHARPEVKAARREAYKPKTGVRGRGQYQAERDGCDDGHKLEGDNLILEKRTRNGKVSYVRRCRICVNAKSARNYARRAGGEAVEVAPGVKREGCITSGEVADILGIERTYLPTYRKRKADFPRPVRVGKPSLFIREEIIRWMNSHTQTRN